MHAKFDNCKSTRFDNQITSKKGCQIKKGIKKWKHMEVGSVFYLPIIM